MAFEYLGYNLSTEEPVSNLRVSRRLLREVDNPFHLPHTEFRKLYRLSPEIVEDIVSEHNKHNK